MGREKVDRQRPGTEVLLRKANSCCKRPSEELGGLAQRGGPRLPPPRGRAGRLPYPGSRAPSISSPPPRSWGQLGVLALCSPAGCCQTAQMPRPLSPQPTRPGTPSQRCLGLWLPLPVPLHGAVHPVDVVGDLGVDVRVPAVPTSLPRERDDAINLFLEDQGSPGVTLRSRGVGGSLAGPLAGVAGAGAGWHSRCRRPAAWRCGWPRTACWARPCPSTACGRCLA